MRMMYTLKSAREKQKLTLREASKRLGLSSDTLHKYEKGKSFPTIPTLRKIEALYNVSYNELIFLPSDYD